MAEPRPVRTRPLRLALLGDPVEHSRSPAMHRSALDALGIAGTYEARRVGTAGMEQAAEEVRRGDLDGANITMPHKHLAYRLADRLHPEAEQAGSVNTWLSGDDQVVGHSTDVTGVRLVWRRRQLPSDAPVLILGSGGAAAAALVAVAGRRVSVAARSRERAVEMIGRCDVDAAVVPWGEAVAGAVVVNCTPLGMHGEELPAAVLDAATGVLDMAYGARPTPAVVAARDRGIPTADGLDLLVAQAEDSFRLWTGLEPPEGVMERAARNVSSTS